MATTVLTDMNPRLEAARAAVDDTKDAHRAAVELRNELVVAAIDQGMSQRAVAKSAGISVARVCAILAGSQDVDD